MSSPDEMTHERSSSSQVPHSVRRRKFAGGPKDCCRTCRLRKVKCPGNPGTGPCANCARLELVCTFVQTDGDTQDNEVISRSAPSRSHTEAGTLRKRAQRACGECHAHKSKCSGDLPSCQRCEGLGILCVYMPPKRKLGADPGTPAKRGTSPVAAAEDSVDSRQRSLSSSSARLAPYPGPANNMTDVITAEYDLLQRDFILRHVSAYFEYTYPVPGCAFLHPATVHRRVEDGTLNPDLATAICAVTATLVGRGPEGRAFAARCCGQLEQHIFRDMGEMNLETLTLVVMAVIYHTSSGNWAKAWMYHGMSARLAKALGLHRETEGTFIEQECARRLMWQIFIMDRFLADESDDHLELTDAMMHIPLPCSDQDFRQAQPIQMESLSDKPRAENRPSMSAFNCRIISLRQSILSMNKDFFAEPCDRDVELSQIMEGVRRLQVRLASLCDSLPEMYRRSERNLRELVGTSDWVGFVLLHMWICQRYMDLYDFALPDRGQQAGADLVRKLPAEFIDKSRGQAVGWAVSMAQFGESLQALFDEQPRARDILATGSRWIGLCLGHSNKILMMVRQHGIYSDLRNQSTAPLRHGGVIDGAALSGLMQSNSALLESISLATWPPRSSSEDIAAQMTYQGSDAYDEANSETGHQQTAESSKSTQLPSARQILDLALAAHGKSKEARAADGARSTTAVSDPWFREHAIPAMLGGPSHQRRSPDDTARRTSLPQRQGMPFLLAKARGIATRTPPRSPSR